MCHTIWEGRQMVNAMKKHKRIVSAGFQNRSDVGLRKAIPQIHEGRIGKVVMARGLCYRNRASIGRRDTPLTPPASVDYNLWLGPAADIPIMRPRAIAQGFEELGIWGWPSICFGRLWVKL
jgi:hypothetical protein